jgi:hypothetical protein
VGLLDLKIDRAWKKAKRTLRLVVRVTERTIDKKGQHLLTPRSRSKAGGPASKWRWPT